MEEQLKALAQQRLQQHRLTQEIIDNIPSAVYIKDLEGRYMVVNKKLCEIFGMTSEELLTHRDADLFPENASQNFRFANEQVIHHKSMVTYEDMILKDGHKHYYWVVKFPLLHPQTGEVQNICGLATDITERKENELQLMQGYPRRRARPQRTGDLPGEYEPRDPHADERHYGHGQPPALHAPKR